MCFYIGTQNVHSQAEEFVIGFFLSPSNNESNSLSVIVTTTESTPVRVSIRNSTGEVMSSTFSSNETLELLVPDMYIVSDSATRYNGLIIKAEEGKAVSVTVNSQHRSSSDSYLALPLINYFNITRYTYIALTPEFNSTHLSSIILLVGGSNNTSVTITPSQVIHIPGDLSSTGNEHRVLPFESVTIQLNQFETLLLQSNASLTGTKVVTNKPITFLCGHQCTSESSANLCEFTIEQFPPTLNWGKTFVFPALLSQSHGTTLSLTSSGSNCTATLRCVKNGVTNMYDIINLTYAGSTETLTITDSKSICSVITTQPSLLTILGSSKTSVNIQVSGSGSGSGNGSSIVGLGDNRNRYFLSMIVPPVEQYTNHPNVSFETLYSNFDSYVNLATTGIPDDILLDGELIDGNWSNVTASNNKLLGYAVQKNITYDNHLVSASNGTFYTGWSYGFSSSYGYGQSIAMNFLLIDGMLCLCCCNNRIL